MPPEGWTIFVSATPDSAIVKVCPPGNPADVAPTSANDAKPSRPAVTLSRMGARSELPDTEQRQSQHEAESYEHANPGQGISKQVHSRRQRMAARGVPHFHSD